MTKANDARIRRALSGLIVALTMAFPADRVPAQGPKSDSSGVTLAEILELARARSPRLAAARARASARAAREPGASTLPDPVLQIGAMNLSVPDLSADMPTSMAPSIQLMQTVPVPGSLSLQGEMARYGTEMSREATAEAWWDVRTAAAGLFYDLYARDRGIEVLEETLGLMSDLEEIARVLYGSGTGRQADVLRASVEVARIDGEIQRLVALRDVTATRLNALLDRPAATPVPEVILPELRDEVPPRDTLVAWADVHRPALRREHLAVDRSRTGMELARKELWPDVTVGIQYGQRDRGFGVERMGGVMLGFTLPVWAGRRQLRARDEAEAASLEARARLQGVLADVRAEIDIQLAELRRARRLVELHRQEILPQARANVESALSSYRVGDVDFGTLVDAELLANRHESELHRLVADYGKAFASLEGVVGRSLSTTDDLVAVVPEEEWK